MTQEQLTGVLEGQDALLERQDALLERQDALLERQDALLERQDEILKQLGDVHRLIRLHAEEVSLAFDEVHAQLASIEKVNCALAQTVDHASRDRWIAKVRSAQRDAALATDMDQEENRKWQRHAVMELGEALEGLRLDLEREYPLALQAIQSRTSRRRLEISQQEFQMVNRLREMALVSSLRGRMLSALGQLDAASKDLQREAKWLRRRTTDIAASSFGDAVVWDDLLNYEWRSHGITAERLDACARKFDLRNTGSLSAVMDLLQQNAERRIATMVRDAEIHQAEAERWYHKTHGEIGSCIMEEIASFGKKKRKKKNSAEIKKRKKCAEEEVQRAKEAVDQARAKVAMVKNGVLTPLDAKVDWDSIDLPRTSAFLLALEGLLEDATVLEGHALEYEGIASDGLSLQEHAARLRIRVEVGESGSTNDNNLESIAETNQREYVIIMDSNALDEDMRTDLSSE